MCVFFAATAAYKRQPAISFSGSIEYFDPQLPLWNGALRPLALTAHHVMRISAYPIHTSSEYDPSLPELRGLILLGKSSLLVRKKFGWFFVGCFFWPIHSGSGSILTHPFYGYGNHGNHSAPGLTLCGVVGFKHLGRELGWRWVPS